MRRLALVGTLALQDALNETRLLLCSLVGLAAVLAPLIVLFGLKSGVVGGLRAELIDNPSVRMMVNTAYRTYDAAFFTRLAARPDVAFLVPRARFLSAEGRLEATARPGTVVTAELLTTAPGDPLLPGLGLSGSADIIPSAALAARLRFVPGETATLRTRRGQGAQAEILAIPIRIAAIAPRSAFDRNGAFVSLPLLTLVEEFGDDKLPASATLESLVLDPGRPHDGFRVHARRLEDVVSLDLALRAEGIEVNTRAAEVGGLLSLDRSLGLLFVTVAGMGGAGYLVSLGVGQYAGVERKRGELSLLRLSGLRRIDIVLFPLLQSVAVALAGAILAGAIALSVGEWVNQAGLPGNNSTRLCVILPEHLLAAIGVTCAGAALATCFAAARAARIPPAESLRHD